PEEIAAERSVMDAGLTEAYRLWWAAELRGVRDRPDIAVITTERGLAAAFGSAAPNA
ncbi:hypothetical protein KI387_022079, partial [Taxus chinensis]